MTGILLDHAPIPGDPHPAQKLSVNYFCRVVSADRSRSRRCGRQFVYRDAAFGVPLVYAVFACSAPAAVPDGLLELFVR
jgi:hypothetical protein